MTLRGSNDKDKLDDLCSRPYKDQGIWFLNAYWESFGKNEAEKVWNYVLRFGEMDLQKHADGNGLDEVNAHRFLEIGGETLTVMAMRDKLRKTGAIGQTERPKVVPLVHYILWKYDVDWHKLVNSAEGNSEEMKKAQQLLDEAQRRAEAAREAEAPFKKAQEEVDAALRDVKNQEDERNSRTAELQQKSTQGGVVQQNKAKAELAQHLAEDPLPLRRALITLEAALKRAEKARAPFEAATNAAEEALAEAQAYLDELKKRPGSPYGRLWWMDRELAEQRKYLPSSRGGVRK